jgi:hypothetical protein
MLRRLIAFSKMPDPFALGAVFRQHDTISAVYLQEDCTVRRLPGVTAKNARGSHHIFLSQPAPLYWLSYTADLCGVHASWQIGSDCPNHMLARCVVV